MEYLKYNKKKYEEYEHIKDEVAYPSVTQILIDCGIIDMRGFKESAVLDEHVNGCLEEFDDNGCVEYDPQVEKGYIKAYELFKSKNKVIYEHIEKEYINEELGIAGRPDRIGSLNGIKCIIGIKTGPEQDWHGLQLAGYQMVTGLEYYKLDKGLNLAYALYTLYLKPTGTYRLVSYHGKENREIFMSAYNLYFWRHP